MNIYMLLDRTGSMSRKWDETLSSINGYVDDLKKNKTKASITLAMFDHHAGFKFDIIRKDVKPKDWKKVTNDDAAPRGTTPLHDAIGRIVSMAESDKPKKAVVVVMTDGLENASREMNRDAAKACLDRCRDRKWQVVFLGADFDAFGQAAGVGTKADQTLNMSAGHYGAAMRSLSTATAAYASSGRAMSWSDEDRKRAAGQ